MKGKENYTQSCETLLQTIRRLVLMHLNFAENLGVVHWFPTVMHSSSSFLNIKSDFQPAKTVNKSVQLCMIASQSGSAGEDIWKRKSHFPEPFIPRGEKGPDDTSPMMLQEPAPNGAFELTRAGVPTTILDQRRVELEGHRVESRFTKDENPNLTECQERWNRVCGRVIVKNVEEGDGRLFAAGNSEGTEQHLISRFQRH